VSAALVIRREWAHREGCGSIALKRQNPHAVVFVPGCRPDILRDRRGGNTGKTTTWQVWICNDIECPARVLVRESDLTELVNASEAARG
jgi:hypothetical protein